MAQQANDNERELQIEPVEIRKGDEQWWGLYTSWEHGSGSQF
jgi:hypothetical protein